MRSLPSALPGRLRGRFHPLYHLRKSAPGRALLHWLDFKVWVPESGRNTDQIEKDTKLWSDVFKATFR